MAKQHPSLVSEWQGLVKQAKAAGLGKRIASVPPAAKRYTGARKADPKPAQLARFLPAAFTEFTAAVGYPMIDLGRGARWAMLPPTAMCQVTGAMGSPGQEFALARTAREKGTYVWPFAFFAGYDLSDVNGWCFASPKDEDPANREAVVWAVEDSLPREEVGPFEAWLRGEIKRATKIVGAKAKAAKLDKGAIALADF
jgi:hypothetical protein